MIIYLDVLWNLTYVLRLLSDFILDDIERMNYKKIVFDITIITLNDVNYSNL